MAQTLRKQRRSSKPRLKSKPAQRKTQTAIVKPDIVPQKIAHWRERRFTGDQLALLKRTVAKGTNDDEFTLFMQVCQKHGLDPFVKEVYCVMFPVSKHHQEKRKTATGEIDVWVSGHEMVIITGIGGYRKMAARDHKDYAGSSEAEFTWFEPPQKTPAHRDIPRSAKVRVHRRGAEDTVATVYWEEFAPADLSAQRSDFWNRMPKNQLEKCAESKALRKAFPGLGDIFTEEEMSQRLQDLTAGGREIVLSDGTAPSGRQVEYRSHTARQLDDDAPHGYEPDSPKAKQAEAALRRVEAEDKKLAEAKIVSPKPSLAEKEPMDVTKAKPVPALKFKGTVEIDASENAEWPRVLGDIANILPNLQANMPSMDWGTRDNFWHIPKADVPRLRELIAVLGYEVRESKTSSAGMKAKAMVSPPAEAATTGRASAAVAGPVVVSGVVEQVFTPPNTATPMRQVKILTPDKKKPTFGCFIHPLFEYLDRAKGAIEAYVTTTTKGDRTFHNIVGLKSLLTTKGLVTFDEDGRTPTVQQKDREPTRTLF